MTLEQLRIFVAVAERQHVTKAAQALNLTQSAVSASIAALEERHATRLFHRVGRGIELTEAGQLFMTEAKAVLARAAAAELALAELGGMIRGTLAVRASQTIAGYWLPRHLVAFRRAHPGIDVRVDMGNTQQVAKAVHDGAVELGFVEGEVDDPLLISTPVARDQVVLVVAPDHQWAERTVAPADLIAGEWITREPGSGTRSVFEAGLRRFGILPSQLRIVLELPSNEAVRTAVEAGMGATVISASVAAPALEAGLLHHVQLDMPEREFRALRHRDRHQSRAVTELLAMILGVPFATLAAHARVTSR